MMDGRFTRTLLTILVLLAILFPLAGEGLARQTPPETAAVIAEGAASVPRREAAWRVTQREVGSVVDGPSFVLPEGAPITVTWEDGRQEDVAPGEALYLGKEERASVAGEKDGAVPFGVYVLQARSLLAGYDRFLIPGLEGLNTPPELGYTASPSEGYTLTLDPATPVFDLPVYLFHAPTGTTDQGSVSVRLLACPAGMRPLDFDPAACTPDPNVADLQIFVAGSGENRRNLAGARQEGESFVWDGLPFGEYVIQPMRLAAGYDRYLIPALSRGLNIAPDMGYSVSPNEGYLLPLDAEHPRYHLDVYGFRAFQGSGSARVGVRFWQCPPGVAAAPDMRDRDCAALAAPSAGFRLEIAGAGVASPLRLDAAAPDSGGTLGWDDVPNGEYRLTSQLPVGTPGYAVRSYDPALRVRLLSDHSGYALVLDPGAVTLDFYLLQ